MFDLCPPALIYLFFCSTQIIIDLFKGLFNTAFFKFIIMFIVTFLLNTLCKEGLGIVSWIIVFIPFMFLTVIVSILLYVFGLNAASGQPMNLVCNKNLNPPQPPPGNNIYVNPQPKHGMSSFFYPIFPPLPPPPPPSSSPQQIPPYKQQVNQLIAPTYSSSPEYESFI